MDTLRSLKKEIKTSSKETVDSVRYIKKEKDSYLFKKRGHRMQYEFNEDVTAKAENVLKKIPVAEGAKASLVNAKELLQQGMSLLGKRQKHIKMADQSEQGWAVVQEYEADALVNNSDNEKKIEKAEKAAERKAVAAAKKRKSTRLSVSTLPSGSTAKFQKLEHPVGLGSVQQCLLLKPSGCYPSVPAV